MDDDDAFAAMIAAHFAPVTCATCGRALDGDPDEDPTGDGGDPICGECSRERDWFVMDLADGELDNEIG
jgi:hypothetical protein